MRNRFAYRSAKRGSLVVLGTRVLPRARVHWWGEFLFWCEKCSFLFRACAPSLGSVNPPTSAKLAAFVCFHFERSSLKPSVSFHSSESAFSWKKEQVRDCSFFLQRITVWSEILVGTSKNHWNTRVSEQKLRLLHRQLKAICNYGCLIKYNLF